MNDAFESLTLALRAVYETYSISVPTVLDALLSRMTVDRGNERLERWSRRLLEQAGVTLSVSGQGNVVPGASYVVMSNHQSHYDVPILFQSLPLVLRMVAKTELYKVPVFGPAMTAAGFIEIDRSNRERAIASLKVAKERLAQGISVWIAPEGTRSRTGELGGFKKGGFVLAMETGLGVLPVGITGSRDILPAHGRMVKKGARVHVAIRPPIPPPPLESDAAARDEFMMRVRASIEEAINEARGAIRTAAPMEHSS